MADENPESETPEEGEGAPKKSKKKLFLGGGVLGLIGAAYLAASAAVPKAAELSLIHI